MIQKPNLLWLKWQEEQLNAWMESAVPPLLANGLIAELACWVSATNVYSESSP